MFLRITGKKVLPSIVSSFLPFSWFHHSLVLLITKEHKVGFKSIKVKCNKRNLFFSFPLSAIHFAGLSGREAGRAAERGALITARPAH